MLEMSHDPRQETKENFKVLMCSKVESISSQLDNKDIQKLTRPV